MKRRKQVLPMAGILLLLSLGIVAGLYGYDGLAVMFGLVIAVDIIGENIAEPKELIIRNQLYENN